MNGRLVVIAFATAAISLVGLGCAGKHVEPVSVAQAPSLAESVTLEHDSLTAHWRRPPDGTFGKAMWFQVKCPRLTGLVVHREADAAATPDDTLMSDYFAARRGWLGDGGVANGELPKSFLIAKSWYPRALLALSDNLSGLVRITWLTYDPPDPIFGGFPPGLPDRPNAILQAEKRLSPPGEGPEPEQGCTNCPVERRLYARVIGSATVDLATGKVIRRTGAVH